VKNLNSTKQADEFVSRLPPKQFKQIFSKILSLKKNCLPNDVAKLKGFDDFYRVDIGEYRIIYRFDASTVYVEAIGKRNDGEVYKKL